MAAITLHVNRPEDLPGHRAAAEAHMKPSDTLNIIVAAPRDRGTAITQDRKAPVGAKASRRR